MKILKRDMAFLIARIRQFLGRGIGVRGTSYPGYQAGLIGISELAGKRLPQPKVMAGNKDVLLDELLGNGFSLVLKRPETGPELDAFRQTLSGRVLTLGEEFTDTNNTLSHFMGKHQAILCRPDKYIFDAGDNGDRLCEALNRALTNGWTNKELDLKETEAQ